MVQNVSILQRVVEHLPQHNLNIYIIAIFKSFVKDINVSNTKLYVCDLFLPKLYLFKCKGPWAVSEKKII
jgi:hypothetical protein